MVPFLLFLRGGNLCRKANKGQIYCFKRWRCHVLMLPIVMSECSGFFREELSPHCSFLCPLKVIWTAWRREIETVALGTWAHASLGESSQCRWTMTSVSVSLFSPAAALYACCLTPRGTQKESKPCLWMGAIVVTACENAVAVTTGVSTLFNDQLKVHVP